MKNYQETLIILHGWQSSKEKWQKVKQGLEQQGIKVIVPDLPGFKKETVLDKSWDLDDYTRWLKNFITETSPDLDKGFFLLGHSFGGRVLIKFAQKYPEKIKGLIFVSSAGIKQYNTGMYNRPALKVARVGKKFSFLPFYSLVRKFFYRYILRRMDYIRAEDRSFLKETFKKIIDEDISLYLKYIKFPTLIIWGEKDDITPISDAYFINKRIANSQLEVLKGVGHIPHLKNSDLLVEKIQSFIGSFDKSKNPQL